MSRLLSIAAMRTAVFAATLICAAPAAAATWTVNVGNPMELGNVAAAASGDTVFRIDPSSGLVTVVSGAGRRLGSGGARAMVTVTCRPSRGEDPAVCTANNISVQAGTVGTLSGRARALRNFTAAMGTATLVGPVSGTNPISFQIGPVGANSSKTFFIGADFPVAGDDSGLPSGDGENAFFVSVIDNLGLMLGGDTDKGKVRAFRSLSVATTADLNFGRIARPVSGSGVVSLDAATGERTVSGGIGFPSPAPSRATFTVTGEGGQTFSISTPASFMLTGPGTIEVATSTTAPASPTLSGALGSAGTFRFDVGGSFPISAATPTGAYSGVLTVSIDYN